MQDLTQSEIEAVSGGTYDDVRIVAAATIVGAGMGSFLGPVGVVAGAASGFMHGLLISQLD
ncbi:MAG: hypothetical protein E6Q40_08625 [Cupriavidus sp.]|nr:MAG: hypothetical protein E6Q40_08625 [Cupriavidus sp.]